MKNKAIHTLYLISQFTLLFLLLTGSWFAGYKFLTKEKWQLVLVLIAICLSIVVVPIINLILTIKYNKKLLSFDLSSIGSLFSSREYKDEKQFQKSQKWAYKSIIATFSYSILLVLMFLFISFLFGAYKINFILPNLILTIIGIAPFSLFFPVLKKQQNQPLIHTINKEDFPYIFSCIEKVMGKTGRGKNFEVEIVNTPTQLNQVDKLLVFELNAKEVKMLSENEFLGYLIHESADLSEEQINNLFFQMKFVDKIDFIKDSVFLAPSRFLYLRYLISDFLFSIQLHHVLTAKYSEKIEIDYIKEHGLAQDYVNAVAKLNMFRIYDEYSWKETSFDVYKEDKPAKDYNHIIYNDFLKKLEIYGKRWNFTLKNQLENQFEIAMPLKKAMEKTEISDFYCDFSDDDSLFSKEKEKLLKESDNIIYDEISKDENIFKGFREKGYFKRIELMQKYDNSLENWDNLSESELIECAQAFIFIDDEKAISILNQVIDRSNNSYALYLKGKILAREYDDSCIEILKKASLDPSAAEVAYSEIVNYAARTGKKDILDEYKSNFARININAFEELNATTFTKDNIEPINSGDNEVVSQLIKELKNCWKETLTAIYIATKTTDSGIKVFYIALEIKKKAENINAKEAYEQSCLLLNRLSGFNKKFYIYFKGKEFLAIKALENSCCYRKEA